MKTVPLLFGRWFVVVALLLLGVLHTSAAASNDSFGSAAIVSASLPATVSGSNVGATEEPGESLLPLVRRTVWWSWTPKNSGWVRASTRGTNIDTFISLFTGTTLTDLARIAFNDDVSFGDSSAGQSELIFLATAGKTYDIQVGGYSGWTGSFSLDIATAATPPQLNGLTFTPSTIDVSTQNVAVTFDLQIAHPAGLRFGIISLIRPDGRQDSQVAFSAIDRISGTAASGTYRITLIVVQDVIPGPYSIRVDLTGIDNRHTTYGERTPFPNGLINSVLFV